jgi:hypothetical protein
MTDLYSPPTAPIDDRVVDGLAWRNAAIAFVASVIGLALVFVVSLALARTRNVHELRVGGAILLPSLVVGAIALRVTRLRWYWLALCAPVVATFVLAGGLFMMFFAGLL